ncbi:ribonuclease H-like domain, reverse transcriptase, RNA-dependent DNA polymerase, partial [Tanacetum coccineum]
KGWKIHHLDVKMAFLHGELKEEVYVIQPKRFEKPGEEEKVYKRAKYLYGLRQAPRAWNIKQDNTLKEMGFQECMQEKAVYKAVTNGEFIIVAIYVDDLFVTGTSLDCINEFKRRMASQFEMSNLGELTYYLGIEVSQEKDYVEIKISSCQKLRMNQKLKLPNNEKWWVAYVASCTHIQIGLTQLVCTIGHVFYLGTSPITWCSQKQTTMALSSCEAEFMAATSAASIALSKNPVFHGRSKHIHTRYHFIRECVENEQVMVEHVSGENQRADPLTKALAYIRFKEMRSLLGVQELPSSTQKFRG